MRRLLTLACAAVGSIGFTLAACSSFSSDEEDSPATDASVEGGPDAPVATDAPVTPPCDMTKLETDAANCSACGHSCLGGACTASRCMPFRIGATDEPVLEVVLDATHVIWTTILGVQASGHLQACPKGGCAGQPTLLQGPTNIGGLASDGVTAYVSFHTGDRRVARIEANLTLTTLPLRDHGFPLQLVTRPDGLYLSAYYEPDGGGYERSIDRWDGKAETLVGVFAPTTGANTDRLLVTDDRVFVGAHNLGYLASCAKQSCTSWPEISTRPEAIVGSMATDGKRIFWTNYGPLLSCPADGAPCTSITTELGPAQLNRERPSARRTRPARSTSRRTRATSSCATRRAARTPFARSLTRTSSRSRSRSPATGTRSPPTTRPCTGRRSTAAPTAARRTAS